MGWVLVGWGDLFTVCKLGDRAYRPTLNCLWSDALMGLRVNLSLGLYPKARHMGRLPPPILSRLTLLASCLSQLAILSLPEVMSIKS